MITAFYAKSFKALKDIPLQLGRINVLIGPNDSGKTSVLHAMAALCRSVDLELRECFGGEWGGRELVWHGNAELRVMLGADFQDVSLGKLDYRLTLEFRREGREVVISDEMIGGTTVNSGGHSRSLVNEVHAGHTGALKEKCRFVYEQLSGVQYFRWDPRRLALPVAAHTNHVQLDSDGFGLPLLLEDILCSDRRRFDELEAKFTEIYPSMGSIRLVRSPGYSVQPDELRVVRESQGVRESQQGPGKALLFDLGGGKPLVPAAQVSDGVLLVLAYLAILYSPRPPRLLLIEEPENGIHPKLLEGVIHILRRIVESQSHTQIVLTTHSPYAVDLFKPEEVTLCTKSGDGSIELTRMSDSPSVRRQISLFSLGEIWTAEGDDDLAKKNAGV